MRIRTSSFLVVFFLISFFLTMVLYSTEGSGAMAYDHTVEVVVGPGDTIWSIANNYLEHKEDPRPLIYEISRLNELKTAVIYPGQRLLLPVLGKKEKP